MKNIGANATNVVRIVVTTGLNTPSSPSTAASTGCSPCSRFVWMFSAMMMPSSTTIPTTMIIPASDMTSMNCPNAGRRNTVPSSVTGMAIATQNAERVLRNIARRHNTNASPIRPFESTTLRRLRTYRDRSSEYWTTIPSGRFSLSLSTSCLIASTVRITSAVSFLLTKKDMAGRPFIRDNTFSSSKSSLMRARSLIFTVGPSNEERTMTSPTSSGVSNWASVTTFFSLVYDSNDPAVARIFRARMALMIDRIGT